MDDKLKNEIEGLLYKLSTNPGVKNINWTYVDTMKSLFISISAHPMFSINNINLSFIIKV